VDGGVVEEGRGAREGGGGGAGLLLRGGGHAICGGVRGRSGDRWVGGGSVPPRRWQWQRVSTE
jgi:hypothetical protein